MMHRRSFVPAMLVALIVGCGDAHPPAGGTSKPPPSSSIADGGAEAPTDAGADGGGDSGPVTIPTPLAVTTGDGHSCALSKYEKSSIVQCWGANDVGQLGAAGSGVIETMFPASARPLLAIMAHPAGKTTCALDAESGVWCWGANEHGQVGIDESPNAPPTSIRVGAVTVKSNVLGVGARHNCITLDDSVGASIACWGDNGSCELGVTDMGTCTPATTHRPSIGNELAAARNATIVAAGLDFTCSLSGEDSKIRCWGIDDAAQCARAPGAPVMTPVEVGFADTLVAGARFACSVTAGTAKCWGSNATHAVSDDDAAVIDTPAESFPGIMVSSIAAGTGAACVIDTSRKLHCRGTLPGKTGTGVALVAGIEGVISAAVGNGHVCVVGHRSGNDPASAPEVLCWGANGSGQASPTSSGTDVATPTPVALPH